MNYFINKIKHIRSELEHFSKCKPYIDFSKGEVLEEFDTISKKEMQEIVGKSKSASCKYDPIPSEVFKRYIYILSPLIIMIASESLKQAKFPKLWKRSTITPLQKKAGTDTNFTNYQLVNALPFLGKITEKAMLRQFNRYVENKIPNYISAYKDGCSTEMVLIDVNDDILMNMDRQRITSMVCTDLLAAFNMVDLDIMMAVLEVSCGVKGIALNWCDSYLRGHSVRGKVKDTISDEINVDFSVPQGNVIGPYFFN